MASNNIIADFVVALGFELNEEGERKLKSALASMKEALDKVGEAEKHAQEKLEKAHKDRQKRIRDGHEDTISFIKQAALVGIAMATGLAVAMDRVAKTFDAIGYAASRTGSSVQGLKAFGYAASQMGSSAEEATAAVETLALKIRENPGFKTVVQTLTGSKTNDIVKQVALLGEKFAHMSDSQKRAYANILGIPEHLLLAIQKTGELNRRMEEYRDKTRKLGFDPEQLAKDGRAFAQQYRSLTESISIIGDRVIGKLVNDPSKPIEKLTAYLEAHGEEIATILEKIAKAFVEIITEIVKLLPEVDAFVEKHGGWKVALEVIGALLLAKLIPGVHGLTKGIITLTGAMGRLFGLKPPVWLLRLFGIGTAAVVAGALAEATPTPDPTAEQRAQAREAEREYERRHTGIGWRDFVPRWMGGSGRAYGRGPDALDGNAALRRRGRSGGHRGLATAAQQQNAAAWADELRKAGYNDNVIAATLGSVETESSFNPSASNNSGGGHTGHWQWDRNRWPRIEAWIKQHHGNPYDTRWQARAWIAEHNARPGDPMYDSTRTENAGRIFRSNPKTIGEAVHGVYESERFGAGEEGGRARHAATWLGHIPAPTPVVSPMPDKEKIAAAAAVAAERLKTPVLGPAAAPPIFTTQPLGVGGSSTTHNRNVSMGSTNINVTGVRDADKAADMIGSNMDRRHARLLRNLQSAIA